MQDGDLRMNVVGQHGAADTHTVECEVLFNGLLGNTPKSVHLPVRSSADEDVLAD